MAWHIFQKDIRLLWPVIPAVFALQFLLAAIMLKLDPFGWPPELLEIARLLVIVVRLAIAFLIILAVHRDAIPGVRQDWLVRPIKRWDLLSAKLLFILVTIHGPMLAADLFEGLSDGFSLAQSAETGLSRGIYVLLTLSLPVLAFATLTRTMTEAAVGLVAVLLAWAALWFFLSVGFTGSHWSFPTYRTGLMWVPALMKAAAVLAAGILILKLQYFHRRTVVARILFGSLFLIGLLTQLAPWRPAFALQQWLSSAPDAGRSITLAFEPEGPRFQRQRGSSPDDGPVFLPLRIAGFSNDSVLLADRYEIHVIGADGTTLYRGAETDFDSARNHRQDLFTVRRSGTNGGDLLAHQALNIPASVYENIRNRPVRMEISYSMTLFQLDSTNRMSALGEQMIPGVGLCGTAINNLRTAVHLACVEEGEEQTCVTVFLENPSKEIRNLDVNDCETEYAPYPDEDFPDGLSRFGMFLPFRDQADLAKYPIDGSQLSEAQVVLKAYQPVAHFTRHLVIPEIRLGDWEAEPAPAVNAAP